MKINKYEQSFVLHEVSGLNPLSIEVRLTERMIKEGDIQKIEIECKGIHVI